MVIDIYKKRISNIAFGINRDEKEITELQNKLNFAIDKAKINNEPYNYLESLKKDVDYLKYGFSLSE